MNLLHFFSITYQALSHYTLSIGCQLLQPPHTYRLRNKNFNFSKTKIKFRQICLPKPAYYKQKVYHKLITFYIRLYLPKGNFCRNQLFDSSIDLSPLYVCFYGI